MIVKRGAWEGSGVRRERGEAVDIQMDRETQCIMRARRDKGR